MKKIIRSLAVVAALASLAPAASATVLTFDDIGSDGFLPSNYGGLNWVVDGWTAFSGEQAPFAAHSGDFRITTQWGGDDVAATIGLITPTVFQGAYFAGLSGAEVSFKLYLGGNLVGTSALLNPSATPTFLTSGYNGLVDTVVVSSKEHAGFVMDDFTFTASVPEPETYALMLAGLGLLGFARRRAAKA
ncbi:PEP-CTERM sorting domain-containing protein [Dechloromonas denitrificans]|uniref:PEP-CTERM sorting domain-containing protein n=1 Tax=Dechloromonas denitrificans TaxID=281362 RepID=UPI001CFB315B|nr:PEP-CTERM sorting domain-containing protein [Dechloromonas denitrificans]UCV07575.1 PEP-CTERM sorting domain-containing protein [Dechloromonas denitrificans]